MRFQIRLFLALLVAGFSFAFFQNFGWVTKTVYFAEPILQRATGLYQDWQIIPQANPDKIDDLIRGVNWDGRLALVLGGHLQGWGLRPIQKVGDVGSDGKFQWKMGSYAKFHQLNIGMFGAPSIAADADHPVNPLPSADGKRLTYFIRIIANFSTLGPEFENFNTLSPHNFDATKPPCIGFYQPSQRNCALWADNELWLGELKTQVEIDISQGLDRAEIVPHDVVNELNRHIPYVAPFTASVITYTTTDSATKQEIVRPVQGEESSMTFDNQLIVFKARVTKPYKSANNSYVIEYHHAISYLHRKSGQFGDSTWSKPRSLLDPIAEVKTAYRLFRRPLQNPDGSPAGFMLPESTTSTDIMDWSKGALMGAYPWVTPDGESVYFTSTLNGEECILRSGFAMVGAPSGYQVRLIDSGVNWSRGVYGRDSCTFEPALTTLPIDDRLTMMTGLGNVVRARYAHLAEKRFPSDNSWPLLGSAVTSLADNAAHALYPLQYRQLINAVIQKGTAWDSLAFTDPNRRALPYARTPRVDVLLTDTGSGIYGEVNFDDATDGSYLLFWHMNEMLSAPTLNPSSTTLSSRELLLDRTPDTSGNFRTGYFSGGAAFSQERRWHEVHGNAEPAQIDFSGVKKQGDVIRPPPLAAIDNDYSEGFEGQSVSFTPGSCVKLNGEGGPAGVHLDQTGAIFETWIRVHPEKLNSDLNVVAVPKSFELRLYRNQNTLALFDLTGNAPEKLIQSSIPANEWVHVGVRFSHNTAQMSVNGIFVATIASINTVPLLQKLTSAFSTLEVGPCLSQSADDGYGYDLDELSFSSNIRTPWDFVSHAYRSRTDLVHGNTEPLVELGEFLFNKPFRGHDGRTVACASCHSEANQFYAPDVMPPKVNSKRAIPSILFSAFSTHLMSDGRASGLENQAMLPLTDAREHDSDMGAIVEQVQSIPGYLPFSEMTVAQTFAHAFPSQQAANPLDLVSDANIRAAIAAYVRSLGNASSVQVGGSVQKFVDMKELPYDQLFPLGTARRNGFELFRGKARCVGCHSGPLLTDHSFHDTGLTLTAFPSDASDPVGGLGLDLGRGAITHVPSDVGRFRTPSLWNVRFKHGLFHNGKFQSLDQVLAFYNVGGQLPAGVDSSHPDRLGELIPLGLSSSELADLKAFLMSLTTE